MIRGEPKCSEGAKPCRLHPDGCTNREILFNLINRTEIGSFEVRSVATYYTKYSKIFTPFYPTSNKMPGFESDKKPSFSKFTTEDTFDRSIRRTKKTIRDYAECNDFELFATFTFSPKKVDRANPKHCKRKMADWLKNEQKRKGKFSYLIIPEFHKDGKSLHFHALFNGYKGELIDSGKKINSRKSFSFKSYTLGFNSAVKIDNPEKVASYVTKYITKDMPRFRGKNRYWASHDLILPETEANPYGWFEKLKPYRQHVNEYGVTLYYQYVRLRA